MKYRLSNIKDDAAYTEELYQQLLKDLFVKGPISAEDMELLSYISILQPDIFATHKNEVLYLLGLFYKNQLAPTDIYTQVLQIYKESISETYQGSYTPIQADIINGYQTNQYVSFAAPTSSGKSYIFMDLIRKMEHDIVIVVPSRALINEYVYKLSHALPDPSINILPFIDKINQAKCVRSIYVVTPERCRELFRNADEYAIDMFLFDEAQLTNEDDIRGMLFDSVVRRCKRYFPQAKLLFAHPFIENPEVQIYKNGLDDGDVFSHSYKQRTVGQVFVSKEGQNFRYFSINKECSRQNLECEDPIAKALSERGSVLIYTPKTQIYNDDVFKAYKRYFGLCPRLDDEVVDGYIQQLQNYLGGSANREDRYYSKMLEYLQHGIVVHHGSLPLEARLVVERFVQDGHCRMCFATSTLEKGVNLPFDVVSLVQVPGDSLKLKNLIGRAGRSTSTNKLDIGTIVVSRKSESKVRTVLREAALLDHVSLLDTMMPLQSPEAERFRDAMQHDTFSEMYNLPKSDLELLSAETVKSAVVGILDSLFIQDEIDNEKLEKEEVVSSVGENMVRLFAGYWKREPEEGEISVIQTANRIFIWRLRQRTFKNICHIRYSYITNAEEYRRRAAGERIDTIKANFSQCYFELPNRQRLKYPRPLYKTSTLASAVDYDKVMYDTYDYIDKTIGFYMSDRLYAAFMSYYEETNDVRAMKMAKVYKYGTYDEKSIMLLRYGLSFEDIETLRRFVQTVSEMGITVTDDFAQLPDEIRRPLERYV